MKPHYELELYIITPLYNLIYYESMYNENGNTQLYNKEIVLHKVSRNIALIFLKGLETTKNIKFEREDDEFIYETPDSAKTYAHVYILEKVY